MTLGGSAALSFFPVLRRVVIPALLRCRHFSTLTKEHCGDAICPFLVDYVGQSRIVPRMADHFVKLWASITDSSIWSAPPPERIVWVTMLTMADEHGFVGASIDGLARRANVALADAESALAKFTAPDPMSRNTENDGRRVEAVPRGWHILNYGYFRTLRDKESRREYERIRKAEQRKRKGQSQNVGDMSGTSPGCPALSAQVEGYGEVLSTSPSEKVQARSRSQKVLDRPDDVTEQTWADTLTHRRAKKAPVTATVIKQTRAEAAKAGITLEEALAAMVANGWQGFRAEYFATSRGRSGGHTPIVPKDLPLSYYADTGPVNKNGWLIKPVEGVNP
jgi:hypothetical protein